jgi:hypothetical protein
MAAAASLSDPIRQEPNEELAQAIESMPAAAADWFSEADGLGRTGLGRCRGTEETAPNRFTIFRSVRRRTAPIVCLGR